MFLPFSTFSGSVRKAAAGPGAQDPTCVEVEASAGSGGLSCSSSQARAPGRANSGGPAQLHPQHSRGADHRELPPTSHRVGRDICSTAWHRITVRGNVVILADQRPEITPSCDQRLLTCVFLTLLLCVCRMLPGRRKQNGAGLRNTQPHYGPHRWAHPVCTTPPLPRDSPVRRAPNTFLLQRESGGSERASHFLNGTQ